MLNITKIDLKNIRGFKSLSLDLKKNKSPRKNTLIIGKNGTCKTTLLRCIAIGLNDFQEANALIAEPIGNLIAEDCKNAEIKIELTDRNDDSKFNVTTRLIEKRGKEVVEFNENFPLPSSEILFLCGYGISRANANQTPTFRDYRIVDSAYTLFRYDEPLVDTELTIRRLKDFLGENSYKRTMLGIKKALGLSVKDKINLPKGGGVRVTGPTVGKNIPLEGLADGYRIPLCWIIDLYSWAMRAKTVTKKGGIEGILLIDELEQHLHPTLQAEVLSRLGMLAPELQVIATTHSPIVTLGIAPDELVVLKKGIKYITAEENVPNFIGFSAEDMIENKHIFNSKIYSTNKSSKMRQYNKLASKSKPSNKDREKLKKISDELNLMRPPTEENVILGELKNLHKKYGL